MATTYTITEHGGKWIVSADGKEVTRYRGDEVVGYDGAVDIDDLKRTVRQDLHLGRADRIIVVE